MQIYILDSEANSLYPDTVWCVVLKEYGIKSYRVFVNDAFIDTIDPANLVSYGRVELVKLSTLKEYINHATENSGDLVKPGPKVRFVGHNALSYDYFHLERLLGIEFFDNPNIDLRDTYVLSRLASPKRKGRHSVEAWGERLGLSKQHVDAEQWATWTPDFVTRCIVDTNIQDAVYKRLRERELRGFSLQSIELEHQVERIISEQQRNGIFVDEEKVHTLFTDTKRHADYLQEEIRNVFPIRSVLIREYNPRRTKSGAFALNTIGPNDPSVVEGPYSLFAFEEFNVDSPKQRLERLLEIGWKPTEFYKNDKTRPKLTEDSLANLPEDAPKEARLIGEYLTTRSRQRLAQQLIDLRDKDGFVHGYIDILGAGTHRMASNNPNLQNIPSTEEDKKTGKPLLGLAGKWGWESRDVFCVKNPNRFIFVDCDASGIQLRGLAHYGGSTEYIGFVSDPTVDIHAVHASVIGCTRAVAKTFIYALLMGAGARKLISILGGDDISKGKELLKRFYERFPFLKKFKEELDLEVERGYHIALDGRLIAHNREKPHLAMSVALQSYEAIIMKRAMVEYHKARSKDLGFIQRLIVHDEFLTETEIKNKDIVGKLMADSIVKAGEIYESKCPLAGQYKTGTSWALVH